MLAQDIYNEIENAHNFGAVKCMCLDKIISNEQKANPEAWTFDSQFKDWERITVMLRTVLDELENLKKAPAPTTREV